jgi:chemotaxis protein methyltransferase CheR
VSDDPCTAFLQWALPHLGKRWEGYRAVQGQVESRLTDRLQDLGLRSLDAYRDYLQEHPDEWDRLDAMCRITVSRFYRDPAVFDALRDTVLPEGAEKHLAEHSGPFRAWSVGAASGEEPYTLRILWRHALRDRFGGRALHVTASETQAHMLRRERSDQVLLGCGGHGAAAISVARSRTCRTGGWTGRSCTTRPATTAHTPSRTASAPATAAL